MWPTSAEVRLALRRWVLLAALSLLVTGCVQAMADQPKFRPYRPSAFFADGSSARPLEADTVARGHARTDELLYAGVVDGKPAEVFPFPVTEDVLRRGQERFNIYCSPCHGRLGDGLGIVVRRGFPKPASFHEDRLRQAPVGYFFAVITNGFGRMPRYATQISVEDRWAIIAYVRALQLSQHATIDDVPQDARPQLEGASQ
jgi:mono/diheme cytochrome c family protein